MHIYISAGNSPDNFRLKAWTEYMHVIIIIQGECLSLFTRQDLCRLLNLLKTQVKDMLSSNAKSYQ